MDYIMGNDDFTPSPPDYKGDGIAIWKKVKDGKLMLLVSVLGNKVIYCNKYEAKPKPTPQQDI